MIILIIRSILGHIVLLIELIFINDYNYYTLLPLYYLYHLYFTLQFERNKCLLFHKMTDEMITLKVLLDSHTLFSIYIISNTLNRKYESYRAFLFLQILA